MKYFIAIIALYCTLTQAEYIDLSGYDMVARPLGCRTFGKDLMCVLVHKGDDYYKVVIDEKGEYQIWKVTVNTKEDKVYIITEALIWARGAI